ncbi:MAG: 4Fe-4S binding protein [Gammaproteobacteria bacterium]|nr:4Fe-4S binding protein [Gammaproteobacteria bacterium]
MLNLGTQTPNGQARAVALAVAAAAEATPVGIVPYASAGTLLILGAETEALAVAERCRQQENILCTVVTGGPDKAPAVITRREQDGMTVLTAAVTQLAGYLGAFQLELADTGSLAVINEITAGRQVFDLVLDLTTPPFINSELLPPGYFAPGDDAAALQQALDEIPGLVGEFEKPQYFHYNASICAHGRSGMTACNRCLDACPSDAIISLGDRIEVNPGLCQGAGSCATACPSGAITYRYPQLSDSLERLRALLKSYRDNGGIDAVLLFHDGEAGRDVVAALAAGLPEHILPVEIEALGSIGMDTWLSALAYGATTVVLLGITGSPASVVREIKVQLEVAHALLGGMGYAAGRLLYTEQQGVELIDTLENLSVPGRLEPAGFAGLNAKRTVIRLAVDHLFAAATALQQKTRPLVTLPTGAPFGEVLLDPSRCTLCLACVSQCPANALSAGDETPQLAFIEANCVQCGLCCRTCPEDAIAISPRYLYDFPRRNTRRILYAEEPFACIRCGKPFATRSMIERMTKKMQGHAMFQGAALARIKMCQDCRVIDIYDDQDGSTDTRIGQSSPGGSS